MDRMETVKALRDDPNVHYNCAQAVAMAYAEDCGLDAAAAQKLAAHFGSGMRHGSTCGAVTAALMVLGMLGKSEDEAKRLMNEFRKKNQFLDCAQLLQEAANNGEARKPHCDRMVYDAVALVEGILKEN